MINGINSKENKNDLNNNILEKIIQIDERLKKVEEENKIIKQKNDKLSKEIIILKSENKSFQETIDLLKQEIERLSSLNKKKDDKTNPLKKIITISEHSDSIFKVSSFPSENFVSVSWDNSIKIFDKNYKLIQSINNGHKDGIYFVSIKDENNFATCSFDNSIKLWEKKINIFECIETILNAHSKTIYKIIYNSKGNIYSCSMDQTIKIWEKKDNNKNYICSHILNHTVFVNAFLLLEDYNMIISAGWDGTYFWDLSNYNLICKIKNCISLSSNSLNRIDNDRIIIGGGNDHIMKVINIKEKKIVFEFDNIFRCYGVLIIKNKDIFITGGMSNNLRIYSIKNFRCIYVEENAHNDTINGISKINDSKIISFSWDHNIKIWEINYEILNELILI